MFSSVVPPLDLSPLMQRTAGVVSDKLTSMFEDVDAREIAGLMETVEASLSGGDFTLLVDDVAELVGMPAAFVSPIKDVIRGGNLSDAMATFLPVGLEATIPIVAESIAANLGVDDFELTPNQTQQIAEAVVDLGSALLLSLIHI